MSFFAELRRRNVVKVGIAYVVASWLLLQLTEVLAELLELNTDVGKIVIILLIVGFVPALIFAWAFEMTPEGIKREHEVDRSSSIANQTGRKLDFAIIAILVVALGYFVFDKFASGPDPQPAPAQQNTALSPESASEPSIAVLPFVNMSADPEQEFFSDGISEELLNLLVRVDGLKVASRTSSFSYKGANPNIPKIASELKVDHILEGSVRKSGNRVRITAQLIETSSDRHLWSDTFDRNLDDIFAIQDEIASAIVSALKTELGVGLGDVEVTAATENLDAYESYLKARELFYARTQLPLSISLFEQAIDLDPNFAKAWEGLAAAHSVSVAWLEGDDIDHEKAANLAARKALELDENLSMPYAVLAMRGPTDNEGWQIKSIDYLDQAIEKDPKNATAWHWRAIKYDDLGFSEKAISDQEQCLAIDPGYLNCMQHLARTLLFAGRSERATELLERSLEADYHSVSDNFVYHYLQEGNRAAALLLAAAVGERAGPGAPIMGWIEALENPDLDKAEAAANWRDWADSVGITCGSFPGPLVALEMWDCLDVEQNADAVWSPLAKDFRKTEEFKTFMNQGHLPFWRERGFPPRCRPIGDEGFECD
jgi:TolB-like protein